MNPLTLVKRIQSINSKEADLGISDEASWHTKYKDSAYVFVGGIPFDLTEGDLVAVFAQYGEVVDVNLVRDKGTGKSKGFAFLAYEDQRSTILAVDNLNGAQILGRIVRVDHCSKYKKKEEEDEETQRQKREERGVCRAFQKGECTRGDGCKFSHDEQRAANTGWGAEDKDSTWGHDKFNGSRKTEKRYGDQESFRSANEGLNSKAKGNDRARDDNRKDIVGREEKRLKWHADSEPAREDHNKRQESKSKLYDDVKFDRRSRDDRDRKEEGNRSKRYEDNQREPNARNDFVGKEDKREVQRSRRHDDSEYDPSKERGHYRREENRSRRHDDDKSEQKHRDDRDYKRETGF